jgi:hypothetical protein
MADHSSGVAEKGRSSMLYVHASPSWRNRSTLGFSRHA